jgi:hypothetical protein
MGFGRVWPRFSSHATDIDPACRLQSCANSRYTPETLRNNVHPVTFFLSAIVRKPFLPERFEIQPAVVGVTFPYDAKPREAEPRFFGRH